MTKTRITTPEGAAEWWKQRAEVAEESGQKAFHLWIDASNKLARVREWVDEPIPAGDDPYQKGIQHAKRVVLAILDGEIRSDR